VLEAREEQEMAAAVTLPDPSPNEEIDKEGSLLAVESHEVLEDIVNEADISQKPLKLEVN